MRAVFGPSLLSLSASLLLSCATAAPRISSAAEGPAPEKRDGAVSSQAAAPQTGRDASAPEAPAGRPSPAEKAAPKSLGGPASSADRAAVAEPAMPSGSPAAGEAAGTETPPAGPREMARRLLRDGRREEAAETLAAAGEGEDLLQAGALFLECGAYEKAAAAFERAGSREGLVRVADALFEKENLREASACYERAGVREGRARTARIVLDCERLFFGFRFSEAFLARLNAGTVDVRRRPSEEEMEQAPELQDLVRFQAYITREGVPRPAPEELRQALEYFRLLAGRYFNPRDGRAPTGLEVLRANYLVSEAAMARTAAAVFANWR